MQHKRHHARKKGRKTAPSLRGGSLTYKRSNMNSGQRQKITKALNKKQKGKCAICRTPFVKHSASLYETIDHIIPMSHGGTHFIANLQLVHYACNQRKGNSGDADSKDSL